MNLIVEENLISFKELEQKIYRYVCELAQEVTRMTLENYDRELAEGRNKKQYRDKGTRRTTIKTVFGEVEYSRHVYQTKTEDGRRACVYLLDEAMQMDKIGLISTNLAEKIAMTVTEAPYRVTAETISSTCGQSISTGGVWNLVQKLGERISEEEEHAVKQMEADQAEGEKRKRSTLVGKRMLAGMEDSSEFHRKRAACIRQRYDADEIVRRILNGDGGRDCVQRHGSTGIAELYSYYNADETPENEMVG